MRARRSQSTRTFVGRIEHVHGPPRAGRHMRRKPARHVSEQRRANVRSAPAPRAACASVPGAARACRAGAGERPEAEGQPVRAVERHGYVVGDEHAVGAEDRRVVEPRLRERREAVSAARAARVRAVRSGTSGRARRAMRFVEPARKRERLRDRAGHGRPDPAVAGGRRSRGSRGPAAVASIDHAGRARVRVTAWPASVPRCR